MLNTDFIFNKYKDKIAPFIKDLEAINNVVYQTLKLEGEIFFDCSFVDLKKIHAINLEYRKIDRPTDVISFALWEASIKTPLLGELFICYEKIIEQAQEYQHSFRRELCFLYLHGLLHLLGYDHEKKEDEAVMFGLQDKILNELQITR